MRHLSNLYTLERHALDERQSTRPGYMSYTDYSFEDVLHTLSISN